MNPDPSDGTLLLKLIGFVLVGLNIASLAVGLLRRPNEKREISPQPLEIVAGDQALPRREWVLKTAQIDAEIAGLKGEMKSIQGELSDLKAMLAAVQATAASQSQALAQVSTKLDRLIERHATGQSTA